MPYYTIRNHCCFCNHNGLDLFFEEDLSVPISYNMMNEASDAIWIPFNILKCALCKTYQTKYLGDLNQVYGRHVNPVGKIHQVMKETYTEFICKNHKITGIIEIGAGNGDLSELILNKHQYIPYYIIDPYYCGKTEGRIVLPQFIEDIENIHELSANTLVTSHVFEHLYRPIDFIKMALKNKIKYIYLCLPDFENSIQKESFCNTLNIEHTFYVENNFIKDIFQMYGYCCNEVYLYLNHSVMFAFEYTGEILSNSNYHPIQKESELYIPRYMDTIMEKVAYINTLLCDYSPTHTIYLWPSSAHSLYLCYYGLDYSKINFLVDNSPDKIDKYFYGYNLKCIAMKEILNTSVPSLLILHGGCFNNEIHIEHPMIKVISL